MNNDIQFIIRRFQRDEDFPRLAVFGREDETIDSAKRAAAEDRLRKQMNWPGHDPERDRWVVTTPGHPEHLIAHARVNAQTSTRSYGFIEVLPTWRRHSIGRALLDRLRERTREQGADQLIFNASLDNAAGHAFLRHHGLQVAGHIRTFTAPTDIVIGEPVLPPGFIIRSFAEVQDVAVLAAVQILCYHDMWGHVENTPGFQSEARLKQFMEQYPESYIQDGIFILFAPNGEPVGVCYGTVGPETNRWKTVDSPGVAPDYRHLELQRPLVVTTMRWLRERFGEGPIDLETFGDFDEAIAIYQELGFVLEPSNHWVDYCLPVYQ